MTSVKSLVERFSDREPVLVAEGYLLELDRRGYQSLGSFIPVACLDHPEKVEEIAREFVFNGSDTTQAFTYYAHRKKMADIGREDEFEKLNHNAYKIARKVARETGTLLSGGLGTLNVYDPEDEETWKITEQMFREQLDVAKQYGVDYMAVETMWDYGEASIALKMCKEYNIPAVITLAAIDDTHTFDKIPFTEALVRLENEGAAAVGLNCVRGPKTIIPILRQVRKYVKGPLACLSTGYETTPEKKSWYYLRDADTNELLFPDNLSAATIGIRAAKWFGEQCKEIGVDYLGFCCGNAPHYMRTLAEVYGRTPPSYKFRCDFHEKSSINTENTYTNKGTRYTVDLPKFMGLKK